MIKLVLSDMDNTLIPFGESRASERTVAAIHELMETGVRFGPATGRDYFELLRFFRMDESCFMTGILSNGKRVRVDGEYIRTVLIPHDALVKIDQALRPEKGMFLVCYPEKTNLLNPAYGVGTTSEELAVFEARTRFTGVVVDEVPDEDFIAATIACPGPPERMDRCRQIVAEAAPEVRIVSPVPEWFDIMPQGGQSSQQAAAFPGAPVVVLVRQDGPCGHVRRHGPDGIETASVPDDPQEFAVVSAVDPMAGHGRILARRLAQQARHDGKAILGDGRLPDAVSAAFTELVQDAAGLGKGIAGTLGNEQDVHTAALSVMAASLRVSSRKSSDPVRMSSVMQAARNACSLSPRMAARKASGMMTASFIRSATSKTRPPRRVLPCMTAKACGRPSIQVAVAARP